MSDESNVLNQAVLEMKKQYDKDAKRANYNLDATIASDAEIKAAGGFTQGIWNAFVAKAANPESFSSTTFINRLTQLADDTGWPYESITAYMSLAYDSYPVFRVGDGITTLYSAASAKGDSSAGNSWVYSAFLTF